MSEQFKDLEFHQIVMNQIMAITKGTCDLNFDNMERLSSSEEELEILEGLIYLFQDLELSKKEAKDKFELEHKKKILEDRNKELLEFNYIASHDLQEPLRTVKSFSDILMEEEMDNLSEDGKQYLKFITDAASRMQRLIMELLDHSRIGRDRQLIEINCNELINEILRDMTGSIKKKDAVMHVGDLPTLWAYETELRQLFQNLISNALKFTKVGEQPVIHISAVIDESKNYVFCIQDHGIGVKEQHLGKIFRIFQRLHSEKKYQGTGIGLANCKKIIEIHEGEIWVESKFGFGSSFYFSIPPLQSE